ncbi:MAG: hypothetical protein M3R24_04415 [Chloroflexota bacterium]|nr:hypothetical protein [Chloroflexota bacterium]
MTEAASTKARSPFGEPMNKLAHTQLPDPVIQTLPAFATTTSSNSHLFRRYYLALVPY